MDDMVSTNIMNEGYQPWNKRTRRQNAHAKYGKLNEKEIKVNQSKTKINYKNQSKTQMNCTGSIYDLLWSLK